MEKRVHIGASIGIAVYPADGEFIQELYEHADIAMYRAKHRGKNQYCFYEDCVLPKS